MLDQWMDETAAALLARWLMEQRERTVLSAEGSSPAPAVATANGDTASDNFLDDLGAPQRACKRRG